ncbi:MAG: rhodanese-related sulfurtransferase [Candidatus Omnitrophota bacterium]
MALGSVNLNCIALIFVALLFSTTCFSQVNQSSTAGGKGPVLIKTISEADLLSKLNARDKFGLGFHLVDLRNESDFLKGFIPGAINIPSKKLTFIAEKVFSKADEVVFYSHSKTTHSAENAVTFMKNKGFMNCFVFAEGMDNWSGLIERS